MGTTNYKRFNRVVQFVNFELEDPTRVTRFWSQLAKFQNIQIRSLNQVDLTNSDADP